MQALTDIVEPGFRGQAWVHAYAGDRGVIQEVDDEWLTITWERYSTTTDVHLSDVRPTDLDPVSAPPRPSARAR